ncbi:TPA: hypothetical protein LA742_004112, partial [Clostridium botulinum]|nr:hypothetical protein [Clostridium botulinum]
PGSKEKLGSTERPGSNKGTKATTVGKGKLPNTVHIYFIGYAPERYIVFANLVKNK